MVDLGYQFVMLVVASTSVWIVLHPGYDDTLTQRIALAVVCFGSIAEMYASYYRTGSTIGLLLLVAGIVIFIVASMLRPPRDEELEHNTCHR